MKDAFFSAFAKLTGAGDDQVKNEPFTVSRLRIEVLSGLTVALALVPEAVAFAFVAQVNPLVGLYAAFIVGLITALIGGRPGMISGATGPWRWLWCLWLQNMVWNICSQLWS